MTRFDALYHKLINEADMNRRDFLRRLGKGAAAITGSSIAPKGLVGAAIKGVVGAATGNVNIPGANHFKSLLYPVLGMIKNMSGPKGVNWVKSPSNLLNLFNAAKKLDNEVLNYSAFETGYSDFFKTVIANNMEDSYGDPAISAFDIEDSEIPDLIKQRLELQRLEIEAPDDLAYSLSNFIHDGGLDVDGMLGPLDMVQPSFPHFSVIGTKINGTPFESTLFAIVHNFLIDPKNGHFDKELVDELMSLNLDIRHGLHNLTMFHEEKNKEVLEKGVRNVEKYMDLKYGKNPDYEEEKQRIKKNEEENRKNMEDYNLRQSMEYSRFDTAGSSEDQGYAKYYESVKHNKKILKK